jgi:hypothetical protein
MILFNIDYLDGLDLLEIWYLIWFIILIIIGVKFNWAIIPLGILTIPLLLMGLIFVLLTFLSLFTNGQIKTNLTLSMVNMGLNVNQVILNLENDFSLIESGSIIVCNYPNNFIEYLFLPLIFNKLGKKYQIVKNSNAFWAKLYFGDDNLFVLKKKENYNYLKEELNLTDKITIVYPEINFYKRNHEYDIQPFRSGIFNIARELNKKVYIVYAQHLKHICGFLFKQQVNIGYEISQDYSPENARELIYSKLND